MRSALNNFILDGIDNNSYGTSNQGFSNQVVQVSPDAWRVQVQTNNFSAEFGRAGGAVVNATFRSGTNQYRGTAWSSTATRAQRDRLFAELGSETDAEPEPVRRCVRGPIARDRAFFFLSYEGFRQVQRTLTFSSVPTMAQRRGDGQAHCESADR